MNLQLGPALRTGQTASAQPENGTGGTQQPALGRLTIVFCVGVLIWMLPRPAQVDPHAWRLLAIFVATVIGIIVKPLPMGAMSVVGIAAAICTRTLTLSEALSGFANGTVWLVMAAFSIAAGFIKTGLGERIAYSLVGVFGGSTLGLGYSLVATDLLLAPAIASNTARVGGLIFPILQSICKTALKTDPDGGRQTSAFLTLTVLHANILTSTMFLTAIATNPLIAQLAANQRIIITWSTWATAAVVPGFVSLAVVPFLLSRLVPPGAVKTPDAPVLARAALASLGPMKRNEWLMALISIALLGAWILGSASGLDSTVAALVGLAALLVTGVLSWDDICRDHEAWNTFVWFATLVMMASYLGQFGMIGWFSGRAAAIFTGLGWVPSFLGLSLTYFYSHYFFASTTAHVSAMYAPFLAVALAAGAPPLLAALVLGFFSSLYCGLTHYAMAAAPILFRSGHVTIGTWWRVGAIVSVINIAIWLGIGSVWWRILGIW